jgi:hypothetical protein
VLVTPVSSDTNDGNAAEKVKEITQAEKKKGEADGNLLVYAKANEDIKLELNKREAPVIPTAYAVNRNLPTKGIAAQRTCKKCKYCTTCCRT